jgi:hypothetical protein
VTWPAGNSTFSAFARSAAPAFWRFGVFLVRHRGIHFLDLVWSDGGFEGNQIARPLETFDETPRDLRLALVVIVSRSQFTVGLLVPQHVADDRQELMCHRHDRFAVAASAPAPAVQGSRV